MGLPGLLETHRRWHIIEGFALPHPE